MSRMSSGAMGYTFWRGPTGPTSGDYESEEESEGPEMTDTQILTLAIAVVVPLALLMLSNSRFTDIRGSIAESKETLRAEMQTFRIEMQAEFRSQRQLLDAIMGKLEDIDKRVTALERR